MLESACMQDLSELSDLRFTRALSGELIEWPQKTNPGTSQGQSEIGKYSLIRAPYNWEGCESPFEDDSHHFGPDLRVPSTIHLDSHTEVLGSVNTVSPFASHHHLQITHPSYMEVKDQSHNLYSLGQHDLGHETRAPILALKNRN